MSDSLQLHGLYSPWNLQARILELVAFPFSRSLPAEPPGKTKNTGMGSLSLLQRIFPTQELNQGLLPCRLILYQLSYQESLTIFANFFCKSQYILTLKGLFKFNIKRCAQVSKYDIPH